MLNFDGDVDVDANIDVEANADVKCEQTLMYHYACH